MSYARHPKFKGATGLEKVAEFPFAIEIPPEQCSADESSLSLEASMMTITESSITAQHPRRSKIYTMALFPHLHSLDHIIPANPYFTDIGLEPMPSLQTDPPWSDITSSMSEYNTPLVQVYHGAPTAENSPVTIPAPESARSLLRNMRHLLKSTPPPSLKEVLAYHASFRAHNSVKTFNFLLSTAIRFASFGTVGHLLDAMRHQGIGGNMETRRLAVRSLVRRGLWDEAWQQETQREGGRALPLSIWLVFFETAKRGATSSQVLKPGKRTRFDEATWKVQDFTDAESDPSRIRILMQNPPFLSPEQHASVAPRSIYLMVDAFLRTGQDELAQSITSQYFQSLPTHIPDEWHARCLDVIHRHLKGGRKSAMQEHFRKRRLLRKFLGMHPSFRPTAATLLYLLQDLRRSKKGFDFARNLVAGFTARWGEAMVDDKVRRRLADLAVKQGRWPCAFALQEYQHLLEKSRREHSIMEQVAVGSNIAGSSRSSASSSTSMYPRRNLEGRKWRLLRRRLWRGSGRIPATGTYKDPNPKE